MTTNAVLSAKELSVYCLWNVSETGAVLNRRFCIQFQKKPTYLEYWQGYRNILLPWKRMGEVGVGVNVQVQLPTQGAWD